MRWWSRKKAPSAVEPPSPAAETYPIRTAMELTIEALVRRSRAYRFLVISVVLVIVLIVATSVGMGSARPLSALLFLVPLCAAYFYRDGHLMMQWRAAQLASWSALQIDFSVLRQGLSMNTALPQRTVMGMLDTLPVLPAAAALEPTLTAPTRAALAGTTTTLYACRSDALLLHGVAYLLITSATVAAAMMSSWKPLLGCLGIVLLMLSRAALLWLRVRRLSKSLNTVRNQPDFQAPSYSQLATALDWGSMPKRVRQRLLSLA